MTWGPPEACNSGTVNLRGSLLLAALGGLPALSCSFLGCSAVGCGDSVRVILEPPASLPYTATLSFPGGQVVSLQCTGAGIPARAGERVSDVSCGATYLEVVCGRAPDFCSSSPVAIELVGADGVKRGGLLSPRYRTFQPNGSHCDPTCRNGSVQLP